MESDIDLGGLDNKLGELVGQRVTDRILRLTVEPTPGLLRRIQQDEIEYACAIVNLVTDAMKKALHDE